MTMLSKKTGIAAGFGSMRFSDDISTLTNPEESIWNSICHLSTENIALEVLETKHGIRGEHRLRTIASNIKFYIDHAYEFYLSGLKASVYTSPLIYYYSFLNLAKALCEINCPNFHNYRESYKHGLSWSPNKKILVDMNKETVRLASRGVWHILYDSVFGEKVKFPNPLELKLKDLFSFCPEISVEFTRAFELKSRLIELIEP